MSKCTKVKLWVCKGGWSEFRAKGVKSTVDVAALVCIYFVDTVGVVWFRNQRSVLIRELYLCRGNI